MQRQTCAARTVARWPWTVTMPPVLLDLSHRAVGDDCRAAVRHHLRRQPVRLRRHVARLVDAAEEAAPGRVLVVPLNLVAIRDQGARRGFQFLRLLGVPGERQAAGLLVPDAVGIQKPFDDLPVAEAEGARLLHGCPAEFLDRRVVPRLAVRRDVPGVPPGRAEGDIARLQHDHRLARLPEEMRQRAADDPRADDADVRLLMPVRQGGPDRRVLPNGYGGHGTSPPGPLSFARRQRRGGENADVRGCSVHRRFRRRRASARMRGK